MVRRRGPRYVHGEGSRIAAFEAQSHGFGTGCLRFAGRVAPTPRKTRFRLLARLFRTGLITRRVPSKGFKVYPTSILLSQVQRSARTLLLARNRGHFYWLTTPTITLVPPMPLSQWLTDTPPPAWRYLRNAIRQRRIHSSVVNHADGVLSRTLRARRTLARMVSALAVQVKACGLSLCS